jgi:hypothetical protein
MPRGWRLQLWNSAFVGLAMIPASQWEATVGIVWMPVLMGICAIGNNFTTWLKTQEPTR